LLGHGNHRLKASLLLVVMLTVGGFVTSHYLTKTVGYMRRIAAPDEAATLQVVDASWGSRLALWQSAVRMWADHPWFGVGPAHFDYRFPEYRPEVTQARPDRVHNDYLNLLADWGAVGGGIVFAGMGIFVFWLKKTWPHVRREENDFGTGQSNRFAFFLGAVCGLAALAVHSLMDFNLHIPANALAAVVLLALVTSNARYATEQFWFRPGRPLKLALSLALGGIAVYFAAQAWRLGGEARWLARAETLPVYSTERAAMLQKAFACEPEDFTTAYEIGECYRIQSLEGGKDSAALGQQALDWYARELRLNAADGYGYLRTGMCLDWLGRLKESEPAYRAAEARDPNGYFMLANIGWHYVQTGDYAAAQEWFNRSLKLMGENDNAIAKNYSAICAVRLAAKASGRPQLPANY